MQTLDRLHAWATRQPLLHVFTMLVRILLAVAFVPSGLVKILDAPFTSLPVTDPVGHFFDGFFSAHLFYRFVGVAQWTAAGLLLIPRTATLGAFLYLPIAANIFVITLAIGPAFANTRVVTGLMLLADLYLLAWDWDRWKAILPVTPTRRHGQLQTMIGLFAGALIGFWGVTRAHLAWLHHASYVGPLLTITAGGILGAATLVLAYRRAARAGESEPADA